jgi:TetR/AcrR family transcriptional repressor of nem operon
MAQNGENLAQAVDVALDLFWRHGYDNASMQELVEATGLNRYALYTRFGSKRDLFLAALDAYFADAKGRLEALVAANPDRPISALRQFQHQNVADMADERAGCMICSVAVEMAQEDEKIGERVKAIFDESLETFQRLLEMGRAAGELRDGIDPATGAQILLSSMLALGSRARAGLSKDELLAACDAAYDTLIG